VGKTAILGFAARRLAFAVPTLVGAALVVFLAMQVVPGDPVLNLLGPAATPEAREALSASYGLDRPLPVRFVTWLAHAAQGDLGQSIAQQRAALDVVLDGFGATLLLTAAAGALAVGGGLALGTWRALRERHRDGRAAAAAAIVAVATPQYVLALALVILLAITWPVLPAGGMHDLDQDGPGDLLRHLLLPAVAASVVPLGIVARVFGSALLDVLHDDFVWALRARGVPERAVVRHAIHSALPSLLTVGGLQIAYLLEGAVLIEAIFAWPGLGSALFTAIGQRDLPVIQAGVLVVAASFVLVNALVDIAHAAIDPRVRG
jgi:peptide/nickel transport system permease protein